MEALKEQYVKEVVPAMMKKFNYSSVMQVPKLEKIVINIGLGETKDNPKENPQTTTASNENKEKNTKEKPANRDFLFTDGYTMENVIQAAQDYLKASGHAGECIPIKDDEGIYLGMRVTFY